MDDVIGFCHYCKKPIKRKKKENYVILKTPIDKPAGDGKVTYLLHKKWECFLPQVKLILDELQIKIKNHKEVLEELFALKQGKDNGK